MTGRILWSHEYLNQIQIYAPSIMIHPALVVAIQQVNTEWRRLMSWQIDNFSGSDFKSLQKVRLEQTRFLWFIIFAGLMEQELKLSMENFQLISQNIKIDFDIWNWNTKKSSLHK